MFPVHTSHPIKIVTTTKIKTSDDFGSTQAGAIMAVGNEKFGKDFFSFFSIMHISGEQILIPPNLGAYSIKEQTRNETSSCELCEIMFKEASIQVTATISLEGSSIR